MSKKPIDLDQYFPFFLGTIANRWATTSSRLYLAEFGIGIAEWRVLASICSLGNASSQDVVGLISMDAGAVSRAVSHLEAKAYVQKVAGRFQGRTKPYELTDEGARIYAAIRKIALERENALLAGLGERDRKDLLRIMRKILRNIDKL